MLGCPERPGIQVPVASTQAPGGSIQVPAADTQVSTTDAAAPVASQSWVHISQPGLTSSLTHAVGAAGVGGAAPTEVGRPQCKAPAGFPSIAEPVGAYRAGYAIRSPIGPARPGMTPLCKPSGPAMA